MAETVGDNKGLYALSERDKGLARLPMLLRFAAIAALTVSAMLTSNAVLDRSLEVPAELGQPRLAKQGVKARAAASKGGFELPPPLSSTQVHEAGTDQGPPRPATAEPCGGEPGPCPTGEAEPFLSLADLGAGF